MALGMTAVILTGGIDLSVGSVMGLVGVVCRPVLQAEQHWIVAILGGLATGALAGAVNGWLIAYVGLPPFVVTLGMLSIARSLAIVLSQNKMIYDFGPMRRHVQRYRRRRRSSASPTRSGLLTRSSRSSFGFVFNFTAWGRYLYAIGGNENAARLTGVPVNRIKMQAYIVSGVHGRARLGDDRRLAGLGDQRAGPGLRAARHRLDRDRRRQPDGRRRRRLRRPHRRGLIEVIRNTLLMAGVDSNWQGAFVGVFIVSGGPARADPRQGARPDEDGAGRG